MRTIDEIAEIMPKLHADLRLALGYVIRGQDELEAALEYLDKAYGFLLTAIQLIDEEESTRPEELSLYSRIVAGRTVRVR